MGTLAEFFICVVMLEVIMLPVGADIGPWINVTDGGLISFGCDPLRNYYDAQTVCNLITGGSVYQYDPTDDAILANVITTVDTSYWVKGSGMDCETIKKNTSNDIVLGTAACSLTYCYICYKPGSNFGPWMAVYSGLISVACDPLNDHTESESACNEVGGTLFSYSFGSGDDLVLAAAMTNVETNYWVQGTSGATCKYFKKSASNVLSSGYTDCNLMYCYICYKSGSNFGPWIAMPDGCTISISCLPKRGYYEAISICTDMGSVIYHYEQEDDTQLASLISIGNNYWVTGISGPECYNIKKNTTNDIVFGVNDCSFDYCYICYKSAPNLGPWTTVSGGGVISAVCDPLRDYDDAVASCNAVSDGIYVYEAADDTVLDTITTIDSYYWVTGGGAPLCHYIEKHASNDFEYDQTDCRLRYCYICYKRDPCADLPTWPMGCSVTDKGTCSRSCGFGETWLSYNCGTFKCPRSCCCKPCTGGGAGSDSTQVLCGDDSMVKPDDCV